MSEFHFSVDGPYPLRFGMQPDEVAGVLGKAASTQTSKNYDRVEMRTGVNLGYLQTGLVECVFFSPAQLFVEGKDIIKIEDQIAQLCLIDALPQMAVGNAYFLRLGIDLRDVDLISGHSEIVGVAPLGLGNALNKACSTSPSALNRLRKYESF